MSFHIPITFVINKTRKEKNKNQHTLLGQIIGRRALVYKEWKNSAVLEWII